MNCYDCIRFILIYYFSSVALIIVKFSRIFGLITISILLSDKTSHGSKSSC